MRIVHRRIACQWIYVERNAPLTNIWQMWSLWNNWLRLWVSVIAWGKTAPFVDYLDLLVDINTLTVVVVIWRLFVLFESGYVSGTDLWKASVLFQRTLLGTFFIALPAWALQLHFVCGQGWFRYFCRGVGHLLIFCSFLKVFIRHGWDWLILLFFISLDRIIDFDIIVRLHLANQTQCWVVLKVPLFIGRSLTEIGLAQLLRWVNEIILTFFLGWILIVLLPVFHDLLELLVSRFRGTSRNVGVVSVAVEVARHWWSLASWEGTQVFTDRSGLWIVFSAFDIKILSCILLLLVVVIWVRWRRLDSYCLLDMLTFIIEILCLLH